MKKSNLAILVSIIVVALAIAAYLFLVPLISKKSAPESNNFNQQNIQVMPEKTADEVIGDVSNPYADIIEEANPFKDEYRNPFE